MNQQLLSSLLDAQQNVIEKIALSAPLEECLNSICEQIESVIDSANAKSSILILDGNQLLHGAAPHLPQAYCDAIDGVTIGPSVGSCGTAVYRKEQVIVNDIEHDPLWADYKDIALQHGLKACWSTPIISSKHEVLGSFAIYYTQVKKPSAIHLELIEKFSHLSSLAIEKEKAHQREQALTSELKFTNEKLQALTSVMPDMAIVIDEKGMYVDVYGSESQLLIISPETLIGKYINDVIPDQNAQSMMTIIDKTLDSEEIQIFEYDLDVQGGACTFEGRTAVINNYQPDQPNKRHVLWIARDITARKIAEEQVQQLAFFDPITALPNRRFLTERLQTTIERVIQNREVGALLILDLDNFKRINDSLGHNVGDQLLKMVAARLTPVLKDADTIGRIAGDDFIIMLEALDKDRNITASNATIVAEKLITSMSQPFKLDNEEYKIRCSIGISLIEGNEITADEALKRVETAMYRSKKLGGNSYSFYEPALQEIIDQRLQIEREIISSIKKDEFSAYFQPQLDRKGNIIGAEALIRWNHPEKGLISPFHFIPVAEQSGLIHQLQHIVLRDACLLFRSLGNRYINDNQFTLAINISACQFRTELNQSLLGTLEEYGLSPQKIKLEITESMLMIDRDHTIDQIKQLKKEGFWVSIDDFGTGYSSLSYLHSFPVDELKIDRSFIDNMHDGEGGTAIVDTIIDLAENLGFTVMAEGVETQKQMDVLNQRNIRGMQGFFLSHPLPADNFTKWVNSHTTKVQ
ncbi:sensor domain-containing phosphodiesterase [Alkalimarinus alittae]|uniref:EAL domain-containing protein n=1 Tax=Alkalimarinus alittae TaxID=2961619 RepID=A0ABY6N5A3_9ALTE|nr:EAL domain-containing protein [Alkalimarinus alittae]UZE97162.1 EAL domain-containing protein [Alkalimarinus alittae]